MFFWHFDGTKKKNFLLIFTKFFCDFVKISKKNLCYAKTSCPSKKQLYRSKLFLWRNRTFCWRFLEKSHKFTIICRTLMIFGNFSGPRSAKIINIVSFRWFQMKKPHNYFSKKQKPHNFFPFCSIFQNFQRKKPYFKNSKRKNHILFFIQKLSLHKKYHVLSYLWTLKNPI